MAGNPQSWNRYAYVLGDPVGRFDPVGLCNVNGVEYADGSPPCPDVTTVDVNGGAMAPVTLSSVPWGFDPGPGYLIVRPGGAGGGVAGSLLVHCQNQAAGQTATFQANATMALSKYFSMAGSAEVGLVKGTMFGFFDGLFEGLPGVGVAAGLGAAFAGAFFDFAVVTGSAILLAPVVNPLGYPLGTSLLDSFLPVVNRAYLADCMRASTMP